MAVAFQISEGHVGYNLDRSEEALLVDAILKVKAASLPNDPWCAEVERSFFDSDRGVSGRHILEPLNARLARIGEPPLVFLPSDWTPYMRLRFEERIQSRRHLRTLLSGGDAEATLQAAAADRDALLPPQEGHWWPKPAPADPVTQRRRAAVAAHLTEKAQAAPAPPNAVDEASPSERVDHDGVARILRVLAGIEARLGAIEAALGLPTNQRQFEPHSRLACIEHRLASKPSPQRGDGCRPSADGVLVDHGTDAQPLSPPVSREVNGRYVFAPGDEQPF